MDTSPLAGWENFYVIIGSSAGGLTGLTFVVIALVRDAARVQPAGLATYVTPTIVHFGAALALAAFLSMPRLSLPGVSAALAVVGLPGLIYGGLLARRLRGQRTSPLYIPVREDWIWNVIFPSGAYGGLLISGVLIWHRTPATLYAVAGLSAALLFIGIRNAWDIAVWMTLRKEPDSK
jgi:hypothetical protein